MMEHHPRAASRHPLKGATPAARQSRFGGGVPGLGFFACAISVLASLS